MRVHHGARMERRRREKKGDPGRNRQTYTGAKTKLIIINSVVSPRNSSLHRNLQRYQIFSLFFFSQRKIILISSVSQICWKNVVDFFSELFDRFYSSRKKHRKSFAPTWRFNDFSFSHFSLNRENICDRNCERLKREEDLVGRCIHRQFQLRSELSFSLTLSTYISPPLSLLFPPLSDQ